MIRQRTEQIKSRLDTVPAFSGAPNVSRGIALAIACVLILGGIWYCTQGSSTQQMEPLLGGRRLSDLELDQIEIAFSKSSLRGWRRDGGQLLIPVESQHEFLTVLEQSSALPYTLKDNLSDALAGGGYFESESARRLRHQYLKSGKLARTIIATFEDIAWASVDYDDRKAGGFDDRTIQSASVVLVPKNGKPLAPSRIGMIQNFVCGAYAGMEPDQVTVTDTSAKKTYNGADDPKTRQQRQAEYELEQRLTELLSGYRGVHVAARSVPAKPNAADDEGATNPVVMSNQTPLYEMRISVGVPESQFHAQWISDYQSAHPGVSAVKAPTAEQFATVKTKVMANIREAVRPMVAGSVEGDEESVRVWSFPDSYRTTAYEQPSVGVYSLASLTDFARSNGATVVPIGFLLLIASVFAIASTRLRFRTTTVAAKNPVPVSQPISREKATTRHGAVSAADETTLRDDLAEMVESNPELAAQIVHSWIADAA